MNKMLFLDEDQLDLIARVTMFRILANPDVVAKPDFLKEGETLAKWFGLDSDADVIKELKRVELLAEREPEVRQALSQRKWKIVWHGKKFSVDYEKNQVENAVDVIGETIFSAVEKKEVRWLLGGLLGGIFVASAFAAPDFLYCAFIFFVSVIIYGAVFVGAAFFLTEKVLCPGIFDSRKVVSILSPHRFCLIFFTFAVAILGAIFISLYLASTIEDYTAPEGYDDFIDQHRVFKQDCDRSVVLNRVILSSASSAWSVGLILLISFA